MQICMVLTMIALPSFVGAAVLHVPLAPPPPPPLLEVRVVGMYSWLLTILAQRPIRTQRSTPRYKQTLARLQYTLF